MKPYLRSRFIMFEKNHSPENLRLGPEANNVEETIWVKGIAKIQLMININKIVKMLSIIIGA
jgi:hypothetical protein